MKKKLHHLNPDPDFNADNKPKAWVRQQYNEAVAAIRTTRKNAGKHRYDYTQNHIDAALLKQDMTRFEMFEQIRKYEESKQSFSNISRVLKTPLRKSTIIEIPHDTDWTEVTEEEDVTNHLRSEFTENFTQASSTPFITSGTDKQLRHIIFNTPPSEWSYHISQLDWAFASDIKFSPTIDYTIENSDLIEGFKKWKEKKNTSPSGRSLSLYKILT